MSLPVRLSPPAREDIRDARRWYNRQEPGLGARFTRAVDASRTRIGRFPDSAPIVHASIRRALVQTFPYAVFYAIEGDEVIILAVVDARRSLEAWRSRLPD